MCLYKAFIKLISKKKLTKYNKFNRFTKRSATMLPSPLIKFNINIQLEYLKKIQTKQTRSIPIIYQTVKNCITIIFNKFTIYKCLELPKISNLNKPVNYLQTNTYS